MEDIPSKNTDYNKNYAYKLRDLKEGSDANNEQKKYPKDNYSSKETNN